MDAGRHLASDDDPLGNVVFLADVDYVDDNFMSCWDLHNKLLETQKLNLGKWMGFTQEANGCLGFCVCNTMEEMIEISMDVPILMLGFDMENPFDQNNL